MKNVMFFLVLLSLCQNLLGQDSDLFQEKVIRNEIKDRVRKYSKNYRLKC